MAHTTQRGQRRRDVRSPADRDVPPPTFTQVSRESGRGDPGRETDVRALSPAFARGSSGDRDMRAAPPSARLACRGLSRIPPREIWGEGPARPSLGPLGVHGK